MTTELTMQQIKLCYYCRIRYYFQESLCIARRPVATVILIDILLCVTGCM